MAQKDSLRSNYWTGKGPAFRGSLLHCLKKHIGPIGKILDPFQPREDKETKSKKNLDGDKRSSP